MTAEEVGLRVRNSKKALIVEMLAFLVGFSTIFLNIYFMMGPEPEPQIWLTAVGGIAVLIGIIAFRARLRQWIEIAEDLRTNSWGSEALNAMRENMVCAPRDARIRILESQFDRLGGISGSGS